MSGDKLSLLKEHMKQAMKAGEKQKLATIRLILSAVKQHEVDKREAVTDDILIAILTKMAKQRRESIEQYENASRHDLVEQEQFELDLIKSYLPEQLSEAEVLKLIEDAMAGLEAPTIKDMGTIMGQLRPKIAGKADMAFVSNKIKEKLS